MTSDATLTFGPIGKTLLKLTSPVVWGLLAIISLNLVDTYFIAQLGTSELASVSFTFPLIMILMNLSLGLSIGASSVISRTIGEGNFDKVRRISTDSIIFAFIFTLILAGIGILTIDPLFSAMRCPNDLLPMIRSYMYIWYLGLPLLSIPMMGNAAINATGDTKFSSMIMIFAGILNLILDPILIFGLFGCPKLGIEGAAIATVVAYGFTAFLSLCGLAKKRMLTFSIRLNEMISSWGEVLKISLPASASQMIVPITSSVTVWMLAHFSPSVVAGYGIVSRLEAFALIIIIGFSTSLGAFVGQNWGAKHYTRAKKALQLGYLFSLGWGCAIALALGLGAYYIPSLFNQDPRVTATVSHYLLVVPISYGAVGSLLVTSAFLNAIGRAKTVAVISVIRYFVLYLPLALMAMKYLGPSGIFSVIGVVNLIMGVSVYFFCQRYYDRA